MAKGAANRWIAIAVLVGASLTAVAAPYVGPEPKTHDNIMVVYVGAEDCAPCQAWRRDHWPEFSASSAFGQLVYREVYPPKLSDLLNGDQWPTEIRGLRSLLDEASGVPMWFVLTDDDVVLTVRGLSQWEKTALPKIAAIVR